MSLQSTPLAFLGGGNMASAIISGLLRNSVPANNIHVSEPWEPNRTKIAALGIQTTTSNITAAASASIVIIAVKPQVAKAVCEELSAAWAESSRPTLPVVVSIAAGITVQSLQTWLSEKNGGKVPGVVRVMPNTPALVTEGASGAFAAAEVKESERKLVEELLGSVSQVTEWVEREELLDVVTGLSGMFLFPLPLFCFFGWLVSMLVRLIMEMGMDRIWPCVLLRHGGTSCCERHGSWVDQGAGY